jgi:hypothetical protein
MNVFEFHEQYKISLAKARRIGKENPHWFDGTSGATDGVRATIAKGNEPTAMQLVDLIENPAGILELGKYAGKVEHELAALGNAAGQVAPKEVVANIMEAAKGEPEAVEILMAWVKEILAHGKPVNHAYIAARLILGIPASIRKSEVPRIPRALLNVRQHPAFSGFWHVEKSASRNRTVYQKLALDL